MKFKFVAAIVMALGLSAVAHADQKVAEYGDPALGNSYGGCTFTQVYSTGGGSYLYKEYQISCSSGSYRVGVATNYTSLGATCSFWSASGEYYVQGGCSNWRVYLRS
ncbi:hypothetical protein [Cellvibrio sp. PSBB023]|uniref:hypothetical protein n=1 Tax=Cellvibrio sp. PSBB023 TaxID=1945512 RepID=UPI00122E328A|nr:hypothetical protein [Cellvibrio sp. PSBB023]